MGILSILCIDDDADFLVGVRLQLRDSFKVSATTELEDGLRILQEKPIDMVLLDIDLGSQSGIKGIKKIREVHPTVDVVMLSGRREPKVIVEALRAGATDYLTKPFELDELMAVAQRQAVARRVKERYEALVETQNDISTNKNIIFKSEVMRRVLVQAEQLKGHQANVLIVGETGTGKDLIARHIHRIEGNVGRPFIAVNCAAIPEQLLESELFGAEPGAYTGAVRRRIGKFELADGGDVFLDEIGSLRLDLQAKILRVLQEKEFCRLGGNEMVRTDFRVIAATNEPLEERVSRGEFRMDLYHRLRVIQLRVPPLRERVEDVQLLVEHYLAKFAKEGVPKRISHGAFARLMAYHWPGNVRELANVIQSLTILAQGDVIDETIFPSWAMNGCGIASIERPLPLPSAEDTVGTLKNYVASAERNYIEYALRSCDGDKSKAARLLKLGRTTLYMKMKELRMM